MFANPGSENENLGVWVGGAKALPSRYEKMDLISLVKELEKQKENSLDLIVDSSTLKAVPDRADGLKLAIPEYGEFPLTEWAHGQLADKLEIPRKYYEK